MNIEQKRIQNNVKVNCFACVEKTGNKYGCSILKKLDCKDCKFYKDKKTFKIDEMKSAYKTKEEKKDD